MSLYNKINSVDDIDVIINTSLRYEKKIKTNKKVVYYNVPCSFDIETSSFYVNDDKQALMYEWSMCLNGAVVIGRTWEEFISICDKISSELELGKDKRLIIYVHNLSFEFQFIRGWFDWENVFAVDDRKPVYALTSIGIEFRCSLILSGYSLAKLGEQLHKYPVQKMVGDLDYSLIRHSKTPLTDKELKYCENDVRVVASYIQETIDKLGDITKIPLTKTGYVRQYCRTNCLYGGAKSHKQHPEAYYEYHTMISGMTLAVDEYEQLERGFQGGFTHANAWYSGLTLHNVSSFDFTSSYPTVLVAEQFPMSKGELVEVKTYAQFNKNLELYCCLFDVEFYGFESIQTYEHPLSKSRCSELDGITEDNGRIVEAEHLKTTLTEQDYYIIKRFYKWKSMAIASFRRYRKGYLPTPFIKSILKLYQDKTELKNVEGKEEEYQNAKEMINACYGMIVTNICRDESIYADGWTTKECDIEKAIEKENNSKTRFLFYPWGVWCTAYARRNLFTGISEFGNDYVYSDTDSVKVLNKENHMEYIKKYNEQIIQKLELALDHHGLDHNLIRPKTIKGIEKPLGVWDYEGDYETFKTLGAKRYAVKKYGEFSITVSGVNKKFGVPYLVRRFGEEGFFDGFTDGLLIPAEYTGKLTHTYIDEPMQGEIVDYNGVTGYYNERSGVHLEKAEYSMSLSQLYIEYLEGVKYEREA